ncbi:hypothetical protein F4808DRAFT_458335 [Astrocystis sublimbata]|nr:hypothetical protein F4808DRAFT_458335 [Astrocystis sublimbata]
MAPSSKGANPAPDYTVTMNRVQTQLEAQLRIVRSFMPAARPPSQNNPPTTTATTTTSTSFSALSANSSSSHKPQQTQRHDAENLFAETTRAQDPNAGLGFGGTSKRSSELAKERENQILRSRLLGRNAKRGLVGGGGGGASGGGMSRRRDSDSDEEPGRSGLGRAKKRARREPAVEEDEENGERGAVGGSKTLGSASDLENKVNDGLGSDNGTVEPTDETGLDVRKGDPDSDLDSAAPRDRVLAKEEGGVTEGEKSKKRKKKKKRKKGSSKNKGPGDELTEAAVEV